MLMRCSHDGPHSAHARLHPDQGRLRFTLVCDECGVARREIGTMRHRIQARPFANSLAERLGRELNLQPATIERLRLASLVRDLGKERLPAGILDKPGSLTESEWIEVRRHPELSAAALAGPAFDEVRHWIRHHHERWDGRGYPDGLHGPDIPLEARVLAVVDAYEAMTADRPHRSRMTHPQACQELWHSAGSQFDVAVVAAFQRAAGRLADTRPVPVTV